MIIYQKSFIITNHPLLMRKSALKQHPFDKPREKSYLRSLVYLINALIRNPRIEGKEGIILSLQALVEESTLPRPIKNEILEFWSKIEKDPSSTLEDFSIGKEMLRELEEVYEDLTEKEKAMCYKEELGHFTNYVRGWMKEVLRFPEGTPPKDVLHDEVLAMTVGNPVHYRVHDYFCMEEVDRPFKLNEVTEGLIKYWEDCEKKAQERRKEEPIKPPIKEVKEDEVTKPAVKVEKNKDPKKVRALVKAVKKGNFDKVKRLVEEEEVDVNQADKHGNTPLWIVRYRDKKIAKYLLEHGADPNKPDPRGFTLLISAIENHAKDFIELLVEYGADVNKSDNFGRFPLRQAVRERGFETVKLLLDKGADVNERDAFGYTSLTEAIDQIEDITIIKLFLDKGAKPSSKDLEKAKFRGDKTVIELLESRMSGTAIRNEMESILDKEQPLDPDEFARLHKGRSPVREVSSDTPPKKQESAADFLNLNEKLLKAAKEGNTEAIPVLIQNEADVNCSDSDGRTPLILAVSHGNTKTAKTLHENGADINKPDNVGNTPLIWAVNGGWIETVQFLLANGADLYAKNKNDQNAFHFACQPGKEAILDILEAKEKELKEAERKKAEAKAIEEAVRLSELGYKAEQEGDFESAEDKYQKALLLNPNDANTLNCLGAVYAKKGSLDMAKQCFRKVIKIDSNNEFAHFNLALIFEKQDIPELAGKHYRRVLEINSKNIAANNNLGRVLEQGGNLESAKHYYQEARKIEPDNEIVCENLKNVTEKLERRKKEEESQAPDTGQIQGMFGDVDLAEQPAKPPASTADPEPIKESEEGKRPTTDQLNGIGLDLMSESKSSPDVRGHAGKAISEEEKAKYRARAKKRLTELYRIIAGEEARLDEELQEAVKGYIELVSKPLGSCIEGIDHRAIAIKLRKLKDEGILNDYIPAVMAHAQDVTLNLQSYEARAEAADTYFKINDFQTAKKLLEEALSINPNPPPEYGWIKTLLEEISKKLNQVEPSQPVPPQEKDPESPPTIRISPDELQIIGEDSKPKTPSPPQDPDKLQPGEERVKFEPLPKGQVPPGESAAPPQAFAELYQDKPPAEPVDERIPPPVPPFTDEQFNKGEVPDTPPRPEEKPHTSNPPTLPSTKSAEIVVKERLQELSNVFIVLAMAKEITSDQGKQLMQAVKEFQEKMFMFPQLDFDYRPVFNNLKEIIEKKLIPPNELENILRMIKAKVQMKSEAEKAKAATSSPTKIFKSVSGKGKKKPSKKAKKKKSKKSK